eukprot:TRINITY_DN3733_c0_g2_i1.p1 TRINITY_DN3733_c0_g2~~TRINITY_DN3733_c0_g2_i1.p1  ORF type:complete len:300 (+),score=73.20 TRINITY_DN3733_c0_g2_i1:71-970(+)
MNDQPITFEVPQIRMFYEQNISCLMQETPFKEKKFIRILASPSTPTLMQLKLFSFRSNDMVSELLGSELRYNTPRPFREWFSQASSHKNIHDMIRHNERNVISLASPHVDIPKQVDLHGTALEGERSSVETSEKEAIRLQEEKTGLKVSGEIRKRKRKSNNQLKILKWEFAKDDYWNKDKITNVAKLTGLSESQVYKWCWDQKKKKQETNVEGGFREGEQFVGLEETGGHLEVYEYKLNSQSKSIRKIRDHGHKMGALKVGGNQLESNGICLSASSTKKMKNRSHEYSFDLVTKRLVFH